jgi:CRISPR-associated exonuclease Cas4
MGDLTVFNKNYLATMQRIADLENTIKELEDTKEAVRKELLQAMEFYGLRSIDNDILTMTLVAPSVSTTIDTKAIRLNDPDTYEDLLDKYPKVTERRQSLRIKVK